jgi:hypothetical protein
MITTTVTSSTECEARLRGQSLVVLDSRPDELRGTLPIERVVGPADGAAPAVHTMSNNALTGATYDIHGGQLLLAARTAG